MSRKFRIDFFKKLQFWVGLFLAGAVVVVAFVGFQVLNPPPTKVLICRQNIPPYTPITADMFAVDSQHLNHSVAARYVTAGELEAYIAAGAVTIEPLYAGDPLTKARLAAGPDANRFKRVSLALDDPDLVIRTIPVSPDICPEVAPGDVVELIFSLSSGQMPEQITYTPAVTGTVSLLPTPTPLPYIEMVEEITLDLPISKRILGPLLVVRAEHEKIRNPNYGAGFGDETSTEPPYLEGDLERLVVLVPKDQVERLDFALWNGQITIGVRSALTRQDWEDGEDWTPSKGWTWTDFVEWFTAQRQEQEQEEEGGMGREGDGETGPSVTPMPTMMPTMMPTVVPTPTPGG